MVLVSVILGKSGMNRAPAFLLRACYKHFGVPIPIGQNQSRADLPTRVAGKYNPHLDSAVPVEEMESVYPGNIQGPLPGRNTDICLFVQLCA